LSGVPSDIVAEATSPAGAVVNYVIPTAVDDRDGVVGVNCAPGSVFPLGRTTVTCTAADHAGNTRSATFVVTVLDTTPPALVCPPSRTVSATSASGAIVSYSGGTVSDAGDAAPVLTYSQASGTLFPIGTTSVTVTATDASRNSSTCSFTVTIPSLAATDADLSITNTASPNRATLGSPLTYTVTVRNNGPTQATDVELVDTVLGSVSFVSVTSSQGRCDRLGGLVFCKLGALADGATATVTIVVVPRGKGSLLSTAFGWSRVADPKWLNNQAIVTMSVR
jgi:uncharacterized repeat protein (TIGR01451 family)